MSQQILSSFIDLVTFDQQSIDLEQKIVQIQKDIEHSKQQQQFIQKNIDDSFHHATDLKKMIHGQELLLKDYQQREEELVLRLETKASAKEYDAIIKELENLRFERTKQEQKLVTMINKESLYYKDYEVMVQESKQKMQQLEHDQVQFQQSYIQLQKDLEAMQGQRLEKMKTIPQQWLDVYETMRGRVLNPVVPVQQDSCSACFYGLTARDLQIIKTKGVISCKECYRFLYQPEIA